jgi:hypothetical protein
MDAIQAGRRSERALVGVSLAQLACGVTGMAVAIRRGHAYDVGFMRGTPETVARDSLLSGTALSAPATMLAAQGVLVALVGTRGSARAATGLQVLGVLMTGGYLAERLVRHRLGRRGWETLESPLAAAGVGLSVGMSLLANRARARREIRPAGGGVGVGVPGRLTVGRWTRHRRRFMLSGSPGAGEGRPAEARRRRGAR